MSNYRKIADEFSKIGYKDTARLGQYQINSALDKIVQNNFNLTEFNRDVAQQLFEQSDKDSSTTILLRDYINTILTAHSVLDKHIKECQRKLNGSTNEDERRELIQNIKQFQEDYQLLTAPFNISIPKTLTYSNNRVSNNEMEKSRDKSSIFADGPSDSNESGSLKLVLIIGLCAFLVELICMFVRHHFLNLFAYLLVLSIFFLNYFDKYTIQVTLGVLGISIILDIVWLITEADPYWNSIGQTQHSTLQPGLLKTVYMFTIILLIAKALIAILLYRFRESSGIRKSVRLLNLRFDLNSNPERSSPIASIFSQASSNNVRNSNSVYS